MCDERVVDVDRVDHLLVELDDLHYILEPYELNCDEEVVELMGVMEMGGMVELVHQSVTHFQT